MLETCNSNKLGKIVMEATTTLADALLDDLDDLSDHEYDHAVEEGEEEEEENVHYDTKKQHYFRDTNDDDDDADGDTNRHCHPETEDVIMTDNTSIEDKSMTNPNRKYTNRLEHPDFRNHMQTILQYITTTNSSTATAASAAAAIEAESAENNDATATTYSTTMESNDPALSQSVAAVDHSKLLTQTNQYLMMIEQELEVYHGKVVDIYQHKFPQLETIITNIQQYIQVVQILDNHTDITMRSIQDALNQYLTNQQIITISIAYSTCNGRTLTTEEIQQLHQYVSYIMQQLIKFQTICLQYIEQQMIYTVPNMVSFLNSSALAAQLLSHVPHGTLEQMMKIPACNLQLIGSTKHHRTTTTMTLFPSHSATVSDRAPSATMSITAPPPPPPLPQHAGLLMRCDLVQSVPKALQMKVLKIVASKLALVIRCDYNHSLSRPTQPSTTTTTTITAVHDNHQNHPNEGYIFRQQVQTKIQQLLEPEKAPTLKALPKPDLTVKKRRGGQRMRRLKGRYEETTLMKQANTRAFSIQTGEYGDDAMGRTLGLLEMSTGSVGASASTEHSTIRSKSNSIEQKKMKYANTRASRKKAAQMNRQGMAIASSLDRLQPNQSSSGMASSMVFTPVQGMELINPDAMKDRVKEANRKWFSTNAGFQSAVPPKK